MDIEKIAKRLLGLIEKSGVDQGEVYVETSSGLEMEVRDQAVERLKKKETGGFALRLIAGGRMAVVNSSDLREPSLEKIVAKGVELAKTAAPDETNSLADPSQGTAEVEIFDQSVDDIDFERKLSVLKDIEALAFAYDPAIRRMESVSYDDSKTEVVIANTKGVFQRKRATFFKAGCSVIAEKDGDVQTGGEEVSSRFFDQLDAPPTIATRACWKAVSLLGGKPLASQTVPVIIDRDAGFALLIHFMAMVNGESIATGVSALKGRIGEAIGSPLVTVSDDATLKGGVGSSPFDDEGTPCSRTVVLDKGVLKSFLFDATTAKKCGAKSTGNARREGFRALPSVGSTNLYVDKGISSPEEIVKSTARGLWAISLTGWWVGINPSTGDFSSGAGGLWIENGEVAYPVRNITVASNVLDMLRGVNAVGNDLYFKHATACPTLRIGEMKIGGA